MRAWLFVLAVLATLQSVTQVASTEEVHSSSSSSLTSSSSSSSSSLVLASLVSQSKGSESESSSGSRKSSLSTRPSIVLSVAVEPSQSLLESTLESSSSAASIAEGLNNNNNNINNNYINNNKNSVENSLNNNNNIKSKKNNHKKHKKHNKHNHKNNSNNNNNINKREKPDPETLVQIEKNLLSLFGFKKRPKIDRSKIVIPEAMKKLYAEIMGHDLDSVNVPKPGLHTKSANTVRSFTHEESEIDKRFKHYHRFRLHFNIRNIPKNEILKAAELSLSRNEIEDNFNINNKNNNNNNNDNINNNNSNNNNNSSFNQNQNNKVKKRINTNTRHQILVYDIIRPGIKGKREPIFLLVDTKTVNLNDTGTVNLDVKPAVERWLKNPKHNYGLLINLKTDNYNYNKNNIKRTNDKNNVNNNTSNNEYDNYLNQVPVHEHIRLRRSADESYEKWSHKQPLLFTYTDDGKYKPRPIRDVISTTNRSRRAPARKGHRRKSGGDICQRRPLYVDFEDVGWNDWIVAPPGYDAFFCSGDCQFPIADHLNTTNHAIVQTLINSINPNLAPKACCVPTQLASISMLYLDDLNKIVLKNYQDMSVVGCGCR